jgi:hypothetical protein
MKRSPTCALFRVRKQDRWLLENRETINRKIRRGGEQLDRGEGIPEDQLDTHLANLKSRT